MALTYEARQAEGGWEVVARSTEEGRPAMYSRVAFYPATGKSVEQAKAEKSAASLQNLYASVSAGDVV